MRKAAWLVVIASLLALATAVYGQGYGGDDYGYGPPAGAGLTNQVKTAREHAGFAASSEVLASVRSHLAHVVNCLEGPRGSDFNAREGNPCEGQGNGIIPDLTARGAQGAKALGVAREANTTALGALKLTNLAQAKAGATKVADLLNTVIKNLPQ